MSFAPEFYFFWWTVLKKPTLKRPLLEFRYGLAVSEFAQQQPRFMTLSSHGMNEFDSCGDVRFVDLEQWLTGPATTYAVSILRRCKRFSFQFLSANLSTQVTFV